MSANATNNAPAIGIKQFTLDVLNGSSLGVVVALIPAALTSQILALFPGNHVAGAITMMVTVAQSLLSVFAAMAVGHMLRLETLDAACIALATFVSSGAITTSKGAFVFNGTVHPQHYADHLYQRGDGTTNPPPSGTTETGY